VDSQYANRPVNAMDYQADLVSRNRAVANVFLKKAIDAATPSEVIFDWCLQRGSRCRSLQIKKPRISQVLVCRLGLLIVERNMINPSRHGYFTMSCWLRNQNKRVHSQPFSCGIAIVGGGKSSAYVQTAILSISRLSRAKHITII